MEKEDSDKFADDAFRANPESFAFDPFSLARPDLLEILGLELEKAKIYHAENSKAKIIGKGTATAPASPSDIASSSLHGITEASNADDLAVGGKPVLGLSQQWGLVQKLFNARGTATAPASPFHIASSSSHGITKASNADDLVVGGTATAPASPSHTATTLASLFNADDLHYVIKMEADGSPRLFDENEVTLILRSVPANSRRHTRLKVLRFDTLLFTFRGEIYTPNKKWIAIGEDGSRFEVYNKLWFKSDSDILVRGNEGRENRVIDYTIIGSKTERSFKVYRQSSVDVSTVIVDKEDENRFLVDIKSKEDHDILKGILMLVTTVVHAKGKSDAKCCTMSNLARVVCGGAHVADDVAELADISGLM